MIIALQEGVIRQLKAKTPMLWLGRINEIHARAREIVCSGLIYN
jgi:hypothetical protein